MSSISEDSGLTERFVARTAADSGGFVGDFGFPPLGVRQIAEQ